MKRLSAFLLLLFSFCVVKTFAQSQPDYLLKYWGGKIERSLKEAFPKMRVEIKGERVYEDEALVILKFIEVLETAKGEPFHSLSSVLLQKQEGKYFPLKMQSLAKHTYLAEEQQYFKRADFRYRIPGIWQQSMDLDGDGKKEHIFSYAYMLDITTEEKGIDYIAFEEKGELTMHDFVVEHAQRMGVCEELVGELRSVKGIVHKGETLLEVEEELNDCSGKIDHKRKKTYYQWNAKHKHFDKLYEAAQHSGSYFSYTVSKQDKSLWTLATHFGCSVGSLKAWNDKKDDAIWEGMKLNIFLEEDYKVHRVGRMDKSLWGIAQKYGVSVEELQRLNRRKNIVIVEGKDILIPLR